MLFTSYDYSADYLLLFRWKYFVNLCNTRRQSHKARWPLWIQLCNYKALKHSYCETSTRWLWIASPRMLFLYLLRSFLCFFHPPSSRVLLRQHGLPRGWERGLRGGAGVEDGDRSLQGGKRHSALQKDRSCFSWGYVSAHKVFPLHFQPVSSRGSKSQKTIGLSCHPVTSFPFFFFVSLSSRVQGEVTPKYVGWMNCGMQTLF